MTESKTLHEYYWSTEDRPFEPVWVNFELATNAYPLVKDAPNPELKSPKYNWRYDAWNDNLADFINKKLDKTVKDNEKVNQNG